MPDNTSRRSRPACGTPSNAGRSASRWSIWPSMLTDGSYHTVDSSDAAFQAAAKLALAEALPKAKPVLLEPVLSVEITIAEALSKATGLVPDGAARFWATIPGRAGRVGTYSAP